MKSIYASLVCLAMVGAASAQTPDLSPPAELQKLAWQVGEWEGESHWTMEGMDMSVSMSVKFSFDGQFLKGVSSMEFTDFGMTMTETMLVGYDMVKKEYVSWAFTNFSPDPRIERGNFDGDKLVMISDPWNIMGDSSVSRATVSQKGEDEMVIKLEMKEGDSWTQMAEGSFKRKK